MISVVVKGDDTYAQQVISRLKLFTLAESLGAWRAGQPTVQHDPCFDSAGTTAGQWHHASVDPSLRRD